LPPDKNFISWPIDGVEISTLVRKFNKNAKTYLIMDMKGYFIKTNNVVSDCLERPVTAKRVMDLVGISGGEVKKPAGLRRYSLPAKRTSVSGKLKKSSPGLKRKVK